jgi:transcriptional regulator with XRE-family HTH domain
VEATCVISECQHYLCEIFANKNVMGSDMHSRLVEARVKAGFASASEAARRLNLPVSTYSAHENGQNKYDAESAVLYARVLKTTAAWLLVGDGIVAAPNQPGINVLPLIEATISAMADLFQLPLASRAAQQLVAEGLAALLAEPQFSQKLDAKDKRQLELEIFRVLAKAIREKPLK